MENTSKNEFVNKLYDNILSHTKHVTNLLVILNGTGAITVFTAGNKQFSFSLFFFIIGILLVVISLALSYYAIWYYIKKIHKSGCLSRFVTEFYDIFSLILLCGIAMSTFCLFLGLNYGYNIVID